MVYVTQYSEIDVCIMNYIYKSCHIFPVGPYTGLGNWHIHVRGEFKLWSWVCELSRGKKWVYVIKE